MATRWPWSAATALALALVLSGTSRILAEEQREIRGKVVGSDGKPLRGAVVRILPEAREHAGHVETGNGGGFVARAPAAAAYAIRVEAPGHAPLTRRHVLPGAPVEMSLEKGLGISGIVRNLLARSPIAGATVLACDAEARGFGSEACSRATTGADGRFALADLPRGMVDLEASAAGHLVGTVSRVEVPQPPSRPPSSSQGLEILLDPRGRIAGRIVGADGRPVEGVTVRALEVDSSKPSREGSRSVTTHATGGFSFRGLHPGRYRLTADKRGYALGEQGPFPVEPGSDRDNLEIRLSIGAALRVRFLGPRETPIRGLSLEILRETPEVGTREAVPVDASRVSEENGGRFTIRDLPPGTYTARFLPGAGEEVEKQHLEFKEGRTIDLGTILVRDGRTLSGHVTDAAGAPIPGAQVTVEWHDGARAQTLGATTSAEGRYRIAGPASATVDRMTAHARGFATAERSGPPPVDGVVDLVLDRAGTIVGRVQAPGGGPAAACRIQVHREDGASDRASGGGVTTDAEGSFRVEDLDPATYTVEVIAEGRAPLEKRGVLVVPDGIADAGTFTLESGTGLHGRVIDARDDAPVAGAQIRLETAQSAAAGLGSSSPAAAGAVSGGDGSFTVEGVGTGVFLVTVEHPSFSPSRLRVEIQPEKDGPEVIVRMYHGGTLTGTVVDAQKQPVAEARIVVYQDVGNDVRTAMTDPDGRYTMLPLTPGVYQVLRQPQGGGSVPGPGAKTAVIREGETTTVDFDETPRILLTGRVLRGETPVPDTTLVLTPIDFASAGEIKSTRSDSGGAFRVGLDRGGTYHVSVQIGDAGSPGGQSTVKLIVPEQSEVAQDIVLTLNTISGRITDLDGSTIKGANVTAVWEGSGTGDPTRQSVAQSVEDGTYRIEGIESGVYKITARAAGYRPAEHDPVQVSEEAPSATVDLVLERGWILRGSLVDPQGRGIHGAMVIVALPGQAESGTPPTTTDGNGGFKITAPTEGAASFSAIASGWAPACLPEQTPTDENAQPVVLNASLGGALRIRVTARSGEPAAGVQVALQPDPLFAGSDFVMDHNRPRPTDADGFTFVSLLVPGSYVITIPDRRGADPVRAAVVEGTETAAVITLP